MTPLAVVRNFMHKTIFQLEVPQQWYVYAEKKSLIIILNFCHFGLYWGRWCIAIGESFFHTTSLKLCIDERIKSMKCETSNVMFSWLRYTSNIEPMIPFVGPSPVAFIIFACMKSQRTLLFEPTLGKIGKISMAWLDFDNYNESVKCMVRGRPVNMHRKLMGVTVVQSKKLGPISLKTKCYLLSRL